MKAEEIHPAKILEKVEDIKAKLDSVVALANEILSYRANLVEKLAELAMQLKITSTIKMQFVEAFLKKPYAVVETGKPGEYILAVPRFIDFPLGYLEKVDESYNYFRVNRYIDWIIELPEALKNQLGIKPPPFPARLEGMTLVTAPENEQQVAEALGEYLLRRIEPGRFQVHPKKHFELIVSLIRLGIMPFTPQPIDPRDLKPEHDGFKLRPWQERAWETFKQYSHIGIFWPYGAGKTKFAAWLLSRIKGPHLIIVPTRTLMETWKRFLDEFKVPESEYEIITYQAVKKHLAKGKKYKVVVYDECHHIPADVFSLGALIPRRYTVGLSGSPFREDGREYYIFALTGKPTGLTWEEFLEFGVIKKPEVHVYIVKTWLDKVYLTESLLSTAKPKTLIYCDSVKRGKSLAEKFSIPFIYGETKNRLELLEKSDVAVISRVGDEGIDIKKLSTVIEVDFLGASRRQESQRLGRLFHSQFKGEHHIIMTEEEYEKFKRRLYPLIEHGLEVIVHAAGRTITLAPETGPIKISAERRRRPRPRAVRAEERAEAAPSEPATSESPDTQVSAQQYAPGIQKILARLTASQRRFLEFLLQNPGKYFTAEELAIALGYSTPESFRESVKPSQLAKYPILKVKKRGRKVLYAAREELGKVTA
ncbi:MAG: helicase-related protein [Nitrososphaerota archaeon]